MKKRHWIKAIIIGISVSLPIASFVTYLDWRQNPAEIFRGATGTHWSAVFETAASWFFPLAAISTVLVSLWFFLVLRLTDDLEEN